MSNAFRGQAQYMTPIYSQAPTGGFNMSGYGGDTMQDLGDLGDLSGLANFGAVSGPASMGGGYSVFGSYNPTPYQPQAQQDYTGGYMPGYGAQLPQQFGGYGGPSGYGGFGGYGQGYGGFASQFGGRFGGGYGGGFGMPQPQQPNVNDLFGQYMFGQYYGQPAFNPFQATSMFGGGRRGGFGGGRRGGRERMFPSQPPNVQQPQPPYVRAQPYQPTGAVMQPKVQSPPVPQPAPPPVQQFAPKTLPTKQERIDELFREFSALNPNMSADKLRSEAEARVNQLQQSYGGNYFSASAAAQQTPATAAPSIDWLSQPPQAPASAPTLPSSSSRLRS